MNYVPDTTMAEMFWTGASRLNRLRYLKRSIVLALFYGVFYGILTAISGVDVDAYGSGDGIKFTLDYNLLWGSAPEFLAGLVVLDLMLAVFSYKLDVRRLKDLGKDNKLALIVFFIAIFGNLVPFITIVAAFINIYLLLAKGTEGDNIYGPDPLEGKR
ncbi:MAG: DUF805 domain-containing protein [Selenomonadaceae bacterium]|nr:DUF805 domain-containing protein [Selenomonadaceae bacterium]